MSLRDHKVWILKEKIGNAIDEVRKTGVGIGLTLTEEEYTLVRGMVAMPTRSYKEAKAIQAEHGSALIFNGLPIFL